jgi:hypothetical protein
MSRRIFPAIPGSLAAGKTSFHPLQFYIKHLADHIQVSRQHFSYTTISMNKQKESGQNIYSGMTSATNHRRQDLSAIAALDKK